MDNSSRDEIDKKIVYRYSDVQTVKPENYKRNSIDYNFKNELDATVLNPSLSFSSENENKIREEFDNINSLLKDADDKCIKFFGRKQINALEEEMAEFINPNCMYKRMGVDILLIAVSKNLLPVIESSLLREICVLRHMLVEKYGYIIPKVKVIDYEKIDSNQYEIYVRGKKVFVGELSAEDIQNVNSQPIIDSLKKIVFDYAHKIMSKIDALKMMELVKQLDPTLVTDLIPTFLTPIDLKNILANLIKEKISVKDIVLVFEVLNDFARYTQDVDKLTTILKKELVFGID